jgi:hypothetical protein
MTWFAFKGYATIDLAGVQEKDAIAIGFHGYATQAQAEAKPNDVSVFQAPLLDLLETDYQAALKEQAQPGGANASNPVGAAVTGAANSIPGLANIGAFFDRLGQAATWIRVAEIILGGALILAGVAKLISGTAAGQAAGTALKAAAL